VTSMSMRAARNHVVLMSLLVLTLPLSWSEALAGNGNNGDGLNHNIKRANKGLHLHAAVNGIPNGGSAAALSVNGNAKNNSSVINSYGVTVSPNGINTNGMTSVNMDDEDDDSGIRQLVGCDYVAETNLPTEFGHYRLRAYRVDGSMETEQFMRENIYIGREPCVIYCSQNPPGTVSGMLTDGDGELEMEEAVPVRIHDQCFTSEVFGSRRCDCREQLRMSLEYIQRNGGAIIYLQQEGRGIGLANKIAAYALQDVGMDTVEANVHLGLPEDCRQYGVIPDILKDMGIASIQLMTNNPRKIRRLKALGVNVVGTIAMTVPKANKFNKRYLETKAQRMNHQNFGSILNLQLGGKEGATSVKGRIPNMPSFPENSVNSGDAMAAVAISSALLKDDDDFQQLGVVADVDGYCFGRQSVIDAIDAIARGEIVVVVDDMDRENEGDFIMAADLATPEKIAEFIRYSSGVLCIGMEEERMIELNIPMMVDNNEDPKNTAFGVTVDATKKWGITTGISAIDRSKTLKMLASETATAADFSRPGHIFPLKAVSGGVLSRDGHTEASVDLSRLAGRHPSGVLCEIVSEENPTEMARLPELKRFCKKHGYVMTSIADIAQYRRETEIKSIQT